MSKVKRISFAQLKPSKTAGHPDAPISIGRSKASFPIYHEGELVGTAVNITMSYPASETLWAIREKVGKLNNTVLNDSQLWRGALLMLGRRLDVITPAGEKELALFEEYLGQVE